MIDWFLAFVIWCIALLSGMYWGYWLDRITHAKRSRKSKQRIIACKEGWVYDALCKLSILTVEYRMEHNLSQEDMAARVGIPLEELRQVEEGDGSSSFIAAMAVINYLLIENGSCNLGGVRYEKDN